MGVKPEYRMYYIAWVLSGEAARHISRLQQYACDTFDSCRAMRSPPHVTIVPPFHFPVVKEEILTDLVMKWSATLPSFDWQLDGFHHFKNHTIYAQAKGPVELPVWRRKLFEKLGKTPHRASFVPHVTIAFRDLSPERFVEAWRYFSGLPLQLSCRQDHVSILRHNGDHWEECSKFCLA